MKSYSSGLRATVLVVSILAGTFWADRQALAQNGLSAPDGSSWYINSGVDLGWLNRSSTGLLGTDNGVSIAPNNLFFVNNEDAIALYFLDLIHRFWWGESVWDISFGFSFGDSDEDGFFAAIPVGPGNNLTIFSPQGLFGGLGGGLNAGPRDAENVRYSNEYEAGEYRFGLRGTVIDGPYWTVRAGPIFSYGHQDVMERINGGVAGINQTFMYYNVAETMTYSVGGRVDIEKDLGTFLGTPVEYYGGFSFERQFHDNDGHSTLDLSGIVNASERQELGGSEQTNRFQAYAGISLDLTKNLDLQLGGRYRRYSTPEVEILPQQVAEINLSHADELTGYVRLVLGFGPPVHESPILNGATLSDRRLKRDIAHLATLDNGIRLYSFKYLWSDSVHVGVMAQDLASREAFRDAVVMRPNGFYAVDYAKLGLKMATLEAWSEYGMAAVMLRQAPGNASALLTAPLH